MSSTVMRAPSRCAPTAIPASSRPSTTARGTPATLQSAARRFSMGRTSAQCALCRRRNALKSASSSRTCPRRISTSASFPSSSSMPPPPSVPREKPRGSSSPPHAAMSPCHATVARFPVASFARSASASRSTSYPHVAPGGGGSAPERCDGGKAAPPRGWIGITSVRKNGAACCCCAEWGARPPAPEEEEKKKPPVPPASSAAAAAPPSSAGRTSPRRSCPWQRSAYTPRASTSSSVTGGSGAAGLSRSSEGRMAEGLWWTAERRTARCWGRGGEEMVMRGARHAEYERSGCDGGVRV